MGLTSTDSSFDDLDGDEDSVESPSHDEGAAAPVELTLGARHGDCVSIRLAQKEAPSGPIGSEEHLTQNNQPLKAVTTIRTALTNDPTVTTDGRSPSSGNY